MLTTKRLSIIDDLVKNLSNEDDKWISLAIAIDLADEVLKVILPDNNVWENQLNRDSRNTGTLPDPLPLDTFKNKKQVSWFNIHPESTSARSAFKLFYSDDCALESNFFWFSESATKYVAVRKDTINAINIIKSRPKKLETVVKKYSPKIKNYEKYRTSKEFLDSLDEKQISYLFDELKEKYGRDIFGKGYLYRIIEEDELVKVSQLTREERENGIDDYKNHYVPYDKGDKDGNRWYLETPYAISWKKSNVGLLRKDPRARYQGYNYYFREGFCWSDIKTTYLKCRIKNKGINDVKSMSLYAMTEKVPEYYIVSLINSEFMSLYVDSFVNNTQTFQINDARQIPVIVPNQRQLKEIKILYDNAINLKKKYFNRELLKEDMIDKVTLIEKKINHLVYEIYGIEE
ncbi:hypothetical protein [Enterococcus faecium]|uniref:hypothetical protein n=1 Tax=Enterococcus faecium TaxID=1352 RepID=UPI0015E425A3|nr:hypothetical protein [Enterococcus faecium]